MVSTQKLRAVPFDQALVSTAAYDDLIGSLRPTVAAKSDSETDAPAETTGDAFLDAMAAPSPGVHLDASASHNRMLTENLGVTHSSSQSPLVDLFYEMEKSVPPSRLGELLAAAWKDDADVTTKLIFHARSISNGKGERETFYRAIGWLVENGHWRTVLRNLEALVAPLARKSVAKKADPDAMDTDAANVPAATPAEEEELDAYNARSTGYYKDLANLLVLSAVGELRLEGDMVIIPGCSALKNRKRTFTRERTREFGRKVDDALNAASPAKSHLIETAAAATTKEAAAMKACERNLVHKEKAKEFRSGEKDDQLTRLASAMEGPDALFHRALHLTVARLFGEQLIRDRATVEAADELFKAGKNDEARARLHKLSLAAKWAPTVDHFHDKHSFLAPSIAEVIDAGRTITANSTPEERTRLLNRALGVYRRDYLSALRAKLDVVERKMSANEWDKIAFPRVPALAMSRYAPVFFRRNEATFDRYLEDVASGKAKISGASLSPAVLVAKAGLGRAYVPENKPVQKKVHEIEERTAHVQWQTMVREVKESGKMENAIAVADVSGSMFSPTFTDNTTPLHSSVALSILVAQVAEEPFKNHVITFSHEPAFYKLDDGVSLAETVQQLQRAPWGMNTDFLKAFRMILDKAKLAKLAPEAMVKRVFV